VDWRALPINANGFPAVTGAFAMFKAYPQFDGWTLADVREFTLRLHPDIKRMMGDRCQRCPRRTRHKSLEAAVWPV
jgi:hypothetical protein